MRIARKQIKPVFITIINVLLITTTASVAIAQPFPANFNLSDLDGNNGFTLVGSEPFDEVGESVSGTGDINGDGVNDFIIGANGSGNVVFGNPEGFPPIFNLSSLDGSNGFHINGDPLNNLSGRPVCNAGDINGDDINDIILGAPNTNTNGEFSGSSYIVFGRTTGFPATLNLSDLDGSNGFRLDGEMAGDFSGTAACGAGDINNDGFDDITIGASGADPNGDRSGRSYVVFGDNNGFPAVMSLNSLNGSNGFLVNGLAASNGLGSSASSAGDINHDGLDDLVIVARGAGESYIIFGSNTAFSETFDLSTLDGTNGFRISGSDTPESVASAGDINNDGVDDLIIGTPFAGNNGNVFVGGGYVVFGSQSGFSATLLLENLNGSNGFRLDGISFEDFTGESVNAAGDINGDGIDDLAIGSPRFDTDTMDVGSSYVVFGSASPFPAAISLASLDGSNGFRLIGEEVGDFSGSAVSNLGDINGDGGDDLLIGSPAIFPPVPGKSYVYYGRPPPEIILADGFEF